MKWLIASLVLWASVFCSVAADAQHRRLTGVGTTSPTCNGVPGGPTLWANIPPGANVSDAVTWEFGGVVPPNFGAYAEQYNIVGSVSGVQLFLTQDPAAPNFNNGNLEILVWSDGGGLPANVLAVVHAQISPAPSFWPAVDCYNFQFGAVPSSGYIWVGCWPNWVGTQAEWFIAADTSWPGNPATNYAPGIGFPTGWGPPNLVWPRPGKSETGTGRRTAITSFGIGAWGDESGTPVVPASWGSIKSLYR